MVGADPQNRIRWQYLDWREDIARGREVGPTIFVASPRFRDDQQPTFEAIDRAVAEYAAAGFDAIKVHAPNQLANYLRLFEKAAEYGIRPIGHPPYRSPDVPLETVLEHQEMVCHTQLLMFQRYGLGKYDLSPPQMAEIARQVKEHGTIIQPTLAINSLYYYLQLDDEWERRKRAEWLAYLPPTVTQDWILNNEVRSNPNRDVDRSRLNWTRVVEQTRALYERDVPLLAGTDAGGLTMSPYGFFFADELRLLVDGVGMTPREALETATVNNARFLGIDDAVGTIEEGKRADLVLLQRNPLKKIGAVKRLDGVMVRGRWIPRSELDGAMAELEERMAASRRGAMAMAAPSGSLVESPCAGDHAE
jgi:cytosine/adenosine deaminase-related metal-dependent hydrolase